MRTSILATLLFIPWFSNAAVLINEIAWMGTTAGANEEWIELYNDGSESVDVSGWTLTDDGSVSIILEGTISSNAFALLERTDDETVPSVTAFQLYTGALANTGATLTLRDSGGGIVDTIIGGENWENVGGDNVTKDTPQRVGSNWVTGTPTPGRANGTQSTPTNDDDDEESSGVVKGVTTTKKDDGPGVRISLLPSSNELLLSIVSPEIAYVNQSVDFSSVASGIGPNILNSLSYTWNFGDTYTATGKSANHIYKYPGEYLVVLNATVARHDVTIQKLIHILPVTLMFSRTLHGDLVIKNTADHDIDLSGYALRGTNTLIFPPYTILKSGGSVTIERSRFETMPSKVVLKDTEGGTVASEGYIAEKAPETVPHLATTRTTPKKVVQMEPLTFEESDSSLAKGNELPATSSLAALTIPVYAAESGGEEENRTTRILPYLGLAGLMVLGTLFLYRRQDTAL